MIDVKIKDFYVAYEKYSRLVSNKSKLLKINIELDDGSLKDVKSIAFVIKNIIYDQA